ncbi:MAG TPA: helix-turn-helix domain-containing protein [Puia sp.]|uniref:helix-turn-helix domain-containing protein n=1 Tax=Puia sp. TaxID=2045100 RepID=UPI002C6343D1|nr:helix-turn-helix domain-containing protein [Puia sp.]HVU97328.1 helix-turn-helix domain-containing protein [Puia sp.]
MQTNNPFELILSKLDQLQTSVDGLAETSPKQSTPALPASDRLLDLAEAAQVVRRPIGTVRYYIHHRNLPATKVGKGYLVKLGELLAWVEEFAKGEGKQEPHSRMAYQRKRYKKN